MPQEVLLTALDVARLLSVRVSTIRAWTSRRKIPFVKLAGGRSVRYRLSDLERLVKAGLRPALCPLPEAPRDREGGGA
jgi:excisionase family DNA binding protein